MKKCSYCAEEIQDDAVFCKHCRSSLVKSNTPPSTKPAQTIELTSKRYKKRYLYSALVMLVGFITASTGFSENDTTAGPIGIIIFMVGIAFIIITKIQIWWHHK